MEIPYRIITVSGLTCSGATTLIRLLSKSTGWPHVNPASAYVRSYLAQHHLPLSAMKEVPDDDEIENESMTAHYLVNEENYIIGGRLAGWLAEKMDDVFRIYITADLEMRVTRFAARENFTLEHARKGLYRREASELEKYKRLYGADLTNLSLYNLVIDTSEMTPEQSLAKSMNALMQG